MNLSPTEATVHIGFDSLSLCISIRPLKPQSSLTPRNKILLEKLKVAQLAEKLPEKK